MTDRPVTNTPNYLLGQIDAKMSHMLSAFSVQKEDIKLAHDVIHTRIDVETKRLNAKHDLQAAKLERLERAHWKTAGILSLIPITFTIAGLVIAYLNMN